MKYFYKKIYFSVLAFVILFITSITSTYAWITLNENLSVETFRLDLEAGEGIQISTDGINFSSYLDKDDIMSAIDKVSDTTIEDSKYVLKGVSPINNSDLRQGFTEYVLKSDGNYGLQTINSKRNNKYLAFDIYFTTNLEFKLGDNDKNVGVDIYFDNRSEMISAKSTAASIGAELTHSTLGVLPKVLKTNISNAIRVGTMVYDTVDIKDTTAANSMQEVNTSIFYVGDNTPSYNELTEEYNFGSLTDENIAAEYYEALCGVNPLDSIENDVLERTESKINGANIISNDRMLLNKKMIKVRFFIWIEGYDPDCIDSSINQTISINLKFNSYVN